ncbi:hypothetical protein [Actinomyces sp.]|uniref:hypothetical protein n=1 Tax=Actinomyces sp. TaxID=29317 RepID=UPI0026DAB57A|nr:hypothetical protein [Actinomyces sp.]MDO4900559.1 hypothetical protein [Actinomyces sp.]
MLLELADYDGDVERAWAAADRWGVGYAWWQLADVSPQPRPDDAIVLYRQAIEETLIPVERKAAREAAVLATGMMAPPHRPRGTRPGRAVRVGR